MTSTSLVDPSEWSMGTVSRPTPYQITAFARTAQARSFSRAAERLGVTQSSVTQHVARLEHVIGAKLFVRHRDGLELTSTGRELFDIADRWAALNDLIMERVEAYSALDRGHLRITATAPRPALPLIGAFSARYPNIMIDFSLLNWTDSIAAVRARDVDIAIITDCERDEGAFIRDIERVPYQLVMRSDHPLASRHSVSLADLQNETLIMSEDGSLTQRLITRALYHYGLETPSVIKMHTFAVVKEAILHGLGVGLLLQNSVHKTDRLACRLITELPDQHVNSVVVPIEKENLRPIRRFIAIVDEMMEHLPDPPQRL